MRKYRVVITPGEPAGIGPDLVIQIAQYNWNVELVVCADASLLKQRSELLGLPLVLLDYNPLNQPVPQRAGTLTLLPISLRAPVIYGKLCEDNSHYVLETLKRSCDGCLNREFSAIITGPVHKGIINKSGIFFTGHTEFLKKYSHTTKVVMMMMIEEMKVALLTTHLPIKSVSNVITAELLRDSINILDYDLRTKFGIQHPRIQVCSLNPHAGENGYIGNEEINVIIPVIQEMQKKGINLSGPLPADTAFQSKYLKYTDVVLTMYHDQGLPVLKYQGFGRGVNITLGLPFIRTSVDHGTALDLAGYGNINNGSFIAALNLAIKLINNN